MIRFLLASGVVLLLLSARCPGAEEAAPAVIMTVTGPIAPDAMGRTLSHEHVLVDFIGADAVSTDRYHRDSVFAAVLPHLNDVQALGVQTLVDATPAYLGRDPVLLRRLAEASGLHLLTNTGYYGARADQHLPAHAFADPADSLAARWIREWTDGIDGSGVRPGFIKIGVDPGALSEVDEKLIRAAAQTHRATGLTIAAHTGPAAGAFGQLAVLDEEGVDPSAWIWIHAQAEPDSTRLIEAAQRGAWISLDGLALNNVSRYVTRLAMMNAEGLLHRVLVSQDAGWYHVGAPGGGPFRTYTTLPADLLPALRSAGFTEAEIHQLLVVNPAEAYTVRVRARP